MSRPDLKTCLPAGGGPPSHLEEKFPRNLGNPSIPLPKPDVYLAPPSIQAPIAPRGPITLERDFLIPLGEHQLKLHARIYRPRSPGPKSQTYLLVHGFQGSRAIFARMAPLLQSQGHTVYAIDLPGHGLSERPGWFPYSDPEKYVEALQGFLRKAGLWKVHLVGHSMGGGLSTYLALRHPERIAELSLLNPWSDDIPVSRMAKFWMTSWIPVLALSAAPEMNMRRGLRNTSWDAEWTRLPEVMDDLAAATDLNDEEVSFAGLLLDTVKMDWSKLQEELTPQNIQKMRQRVRKVHVLYGDKDTLIPEGQMKALADRLRGTVTVVENVGHNTPLESPEVAGFMAGEGPIPRRLYHRRRSDSPSPPGTYGGPYFQMGLRGGAENDLGGVRADHFDLFGQFYLNLDSDHPDSLQLGLEFGLQGTESLGDTDKSGFAFSRPKFYWFRDSWLELSSGIVPKGGVGEFTGDFQGFFSLDANPLFAEWIFMNNGALGSIFLNSGFNLYGTQLDNSGDILERSSVGLGMALSL